MKATRCTVDGCDRPHRCKGYCAIHYGRLLKTGSLELTPHVDPGCAVEDCDRPHNSRGYCRAHYKRLLEFGDVRADQPLVHKPRVVERDDVVTRIMRQTYVADSGCIIWTGYVNAANGYGSIGWRGKDWVVHRAIWTALRGPIPTEGDLTLDHLCFTRACVNLDHLEVVPRGENTRRALARRYPDGAQPRVRKPRRSA